MSQGRSLGRLGAALIGATLLGAPAPAQTPRPVAPPKSATAPVTKTFLREALASAGVRLETALRSEAPPARKPPRSGAARRRWPRGARGPSRMPS